MEEIPETKLPPEPVTRKTVEDYLKIQGVIAQITPEELERFAALAIRFQFNPFLRELHLVSSSDKGARRFVAVVGYEVYLKKAEKTGKLDGWKAWTEGDGETLKAILEIYRQGWSHPFIHEVHWAEAVQRQDDGTPTAFWKRMPKFQLRKVCISQGFRLCFPEELGGIPYEAAELSLDEAVTKTEAGKAAVSTATQVAGTTVAAGTPKSAFAELDAYLTDNAEAFTAKHYRWIKEQLEKTPTLEKAKAMLGYARKVVLQGGDPQEEPKGPGPMPAVPSESPTRFPNPHSEGGRHECITRKASSSLLRPWGRTGG